MSFCLNTCYLHLCSYVTLSQTSVIKKVCHYVLLSKQLVTLSLTRTQKKEDTVKMSSL